MTALDRPIRLTVAEYEAYRLVYELASTSRQALRDERLREAVQAVTALDDARYGQEVLP